MCLNEVSPQLASRHVKPCQLGAPDHQKLRVVVQAGTQPLGRGSEGGDRAHAVSSRYFLRQPAAAHGARTDGTLIARTGGNDMATAGSALGLEKSIRANERLALPGDLHTAL